MFTESTLIDASGVIRRGSGLPESKFGGRIYGYPWTISFFAEHYLVTKDMHNLDTATNIADRAAEIGSGRFLSVEFAESSAALARMLKQIGQTEEIQRLLDRMVVSADYFLGLGIDLPYHKVSYEQSITAPLVSLSLETHHITGRAEYLDGVAERLDWLLVFSGSRPDSRLYDMAVRHWDGYRFGINR